MATTKNKSILAENSGTSIKKKKTMTTTVFHHTKTDYILTQYV